MAITLHSSFAVHPGLWLHTEMVEQRGISVTDLAARLGVTRQAMSALLNERAGLSAEMAIRFEKAFGLSAEDPGADAGGARPCAGAGAGCRFPHRPVRGLTLRPEGRNLPGREP